MTLKPKLDNNYYLPDLLPPPKPDVDYKPKVILYDHNGKPLKRKVGF